MSRYRKFLYPFLVVTAAIIAFVVLVQWIKPKSEGKGFPPLFTIGTETTHFLGPVTESGFIDYAQAFNLETGKGLTEKDNAAIDLLKALGPDPAMHFFGMVGPPLDLTPVYENLGMEPLSASGAYFIDLSAFAEAADATGRLPGLEKYPAGTSPFEFAGEEVSLGTTRPWKGSERPFLLQWLKKNEVPLEFVTRASQKKRLFIPATLQTPPCLASRMIPELEIDDEPLTLAPFFAVTQEFTKMLQALTARSMWHLGEGRHEQAWEDLMTCQRTAVLMSGSGAGSEYLESVGIEKDTQEVALVFLQEKNLDSKFFRKMVFDLQQLSHLENPVKIYNKYKRYYSLSLAMSFNRSGMSSAINVYANMFIIDSADIPQLSSFGLYFLPSRQKQAMKRIQWDPILREINEQYDGMVADLRIPDRAAKIAALRSRQLKLDTMKIGARTSFEEWADFLFQNQARPKWDMQKSAHDFCMWLLPDDPMTFLDLWERNRQNWSNLTVAAALEAFKREKGIYPASLNDLSGGYLREVPLDLYSNKALKYRRNDAGYLLYSIGSDEIDDGGRIQRLGEKNRRHRHRNAPSRQACEP